MSLKQTYGKYPYSVDVLDIVRAIPQGALGGVAAWMAKTSGDAAVKGAVIGAAANALVRAQIAMEYSSYQLAAPDQPVYATTPDFAMHQAFVGLVEAAVGAGLGAGFAWLLKTFLK
jgi:hypothetical protein